MFKTTTQTPRRDKEAGTNTSDFDVLGAFDKTAIELPNHSAQMSKLGESVVTLENTPQTNIIDTNKSQNLKGNSFSKP